MGPWPLAQVEVQPTESDDLFNLQVRASGSPLVSTAAMPDWAALTGNALGSASAAFNHSDFAVPVDGAEMRVTWHYVPTPSPLLTDIANAGNRAPMLGAVRLRALAPAKVLAVEDAR